MKKLINKFLQICLQTWKRWSYNKGQSHRKLQLLEWNLETLYWEWGEGGQRNIGIEGDFHGFFCLFFSICLLMLFNQCELGVPKTCEEILRLKIWNIMVTSVAPIPNQIVICSFYYYNQLLHHYINDIMKEHREDLSGFGTLWHPAVSWETGSFQLGRSAIGTTYVF